MSNGSSVIVGPGLFAGVGVQGGAGLSNSPLPGERVALRRGGKSDAAVGGAGEPVKLVGDFGERLARERSGLRRLSAAIPVPAGSFILLACFTQLRGNSVAFAGGADGLADNLARGSVVFRKRKVQTIHCWMSRIEIAKS